MTEREKILEVALIECFDAAIPQAMPWTGTAAEKADYAAKVLAGQIRGINRLLHGKALDREKAVEVEREACAAIAYAFAEEVGSRDGVDIAHRIRARSELEAL